MSENKPFPMNAWYAAAWGHEIKHELAARTICGKDVVLYRGRTARSPRSRTPAGTGCCRCRWAVWRATRSSAAITASSSMLRAAAPICRPRRPSTRRPACVPIRSPKSIGSSGSGPAIRRSRIPAWMPDFHWNDGTDWVGEGGTFYSLKCDYRLVIDNLMDLTHETYVHAGSIGDEAITGTPFDVTHTDHTATVTRWMIDIDPPPFWAKQLGRPGTCRPLADHLLPGALRRGCRRRRRRADGTGAPQGRPLAGRERRIPRRHHAGKRDDLPLFLELRPHLQDGRRAAHAGHHQRRPRQRRQGRLRPGSRRCSRRSRRPSTAIRACPSTTSTSMPARCGRGGMIDGARWPRSTRRPARARIARPPSSRAVAACPSNGGAAVAPLDPRPRRPTSGCSRSSRRANSFRRRPAATSTSPCRSAAARTRGPIRSSARARTECIVSR